MFRYGVLFPLAACALSLAIGCTKPAGEVELFQPRAAKDYGRPLPPGALALRKIPPEDYPDFRLGFDDRTGFEDAIRNSLNYLAKPSSRQYYPYGEITHAQVVASLERFLEILRSSRTANQFDATIVTEFDVYQSVGCDDRGTVFFTGYYTPIFDGRLTRTADFRYPLYYLPPDLEKDGEGRTLGRRLPNGRIEPRYPTRREIEEGRLLDGLEIAYVRTAFEAYVITVQGSAKLRLEDGSFFEIGYAGNNGHEYTPISKAMIEDGVIGRSELSMQRLRAYFELHPEQVFHYAWRNDRYVFFQESVGGARGSLNEPVTPFRSLATDKSVFPRAALTFITTDLPVAYDSTVKAVPYAGFALDQDTGGAIRAAGRSDIYMGVGPDAEKIAGRTGAEGALYYLFLKPERVAGRR